MPGRRFLENNDVVDGFEPVLAGGFFDKSSLDPDFVADEERRVTRGYLRLLEVMSLELPIIDYPLPEALARWRDGEGMPVAPAGRGA